MSTGLFYHLWPAPLVNALQLEGVKTWSDLAALSQAALLTHHRVSRKSLAFVEARLEQQGLELAGTDWRPIRAPITADQAACWVYFVACEGFVKIGRAKRIKARLKSIETLLPFPLTVVASLPYETEADAARAEALLHQRYADLHHRGEWFAYRGQLRDYITYLQGEAGVA